MHAFYTKPYQENFTVLSQKSEDVHKQMCSCYKYALNKKHSSQMKTWIYEILNYLKSATERQN